MCFARHTQRERVICPTLKQNDNSKFNGGHNFDGDTGGKGAGEGKNGQKGEQFVEDCNGVEGRVRNTKICR